MYELFHYFSGEHLLLQLAWEQLSQMNLGWNGIGFNMVAGVRHREHPEIPYMNTSSLEIS